MLYGVWSRPALNRRCVLVGLKTNRDLLYMNERFEAGQLVPIIDGPYTLDEGPDAFRHFGAGHYKGKVVITI